VGSEVVNLVFKPIFLAQNKFPARIWPKSNEIKAQNIHKWCYGVQRSKLVGNWAGTDLWGPCIMGKRSEALTKFWSLLRSFLGLTRWRIGSKCHASHPLSNWMKLYSIERRYSSEVVETWDHGHVVDGNSAHWSVACREGDVLEGNTGTCFYVNNSCLWLAVWPKQCRCKLDRKIIYTPPFTPS
jgi:hypothetical protein